MDPSKLKLKHSPLQEVVFDIDCDFEAGLDFDQIGTAAPRTFADYPSLGKPYRHTINPDFDGPSSNPKESMVGLVFRNDTLGRIIQIRADGFSFNVLAYTGFEDVISDMEIGWKAFLSLAKPILVREVRIRSINRIELDQFATHEVIRFLDAETLASGFVAGDTFTQYVSEKPQDGLTSVTTVASQTKERTLILDLVVGKSKSLEPNWEDIETILKELRLLKNEVFLKAVEDKWLQSVL